MDLNTLLLIAFAVMMLFCCGGLGRLFRRGGESDSRLTESDVATADVAAKKTKPSRGGCCH
jgi:hypothetical protein